MEQSYNFSLTPFSLQVERPEPHGLRRFAFLENNKQVHPRWSLFLAIFAIKHPTCSTSELLMLAQEQVRNKWFFQISYVDTAPTNRRLFDMLCEFLESTIHIYVLYHSETSPTFVYEWPKNQRVCRLGLTGRKTYCIMPPPQLQDDTPGVKIASNTVDSDPSPNQHWVFCDALTKKMKQEADQRFPVTEQLRYLNVIDKLQRAGVLVKLGDFIENRSLATYGCKQFISRRSTKETLLIAITYKICDEEESTTKLFYADEHGNVVASFLAFLSELTKRNADHLRANRFGPYYTKLDELERFHHKNVLRACVVGRARQALDRLVDQFPIIDISSAVPQVYFTKNLPTTR